MGAITTLVSAGADAYANLFDVEITFPSAITDTITQDVLSMSVRVVDFKPPELKQSTYKTPYKGIEVTKLGPKIEGERVFSIPYRIDANYELHIALQKWKHLYADASGEGNINFNSLYKNAMTNSLRSFGTVKVKAFTGETKNLTDFAGSDTSIPTSGVATGWEFYEVACTEAGPPSFDRGGGDPAKAEAKFLFIRMKEPGSSISAKGDTPDTASYSSDK